MNLSSWEHLFPIICSSHMIAQSFQDDQLAQSSTFATSDFQNKEEKPACRLSIYSFKLGTVYQVSILFYLVVTVRDGRSTCVFHLSVTMI